MPLGSLTKKKLKAVLAKAPQNNTLEKIVQSEAALFANKEGTEAVLWLAR